MSRILGNAGRAGTLGTGGVPLPSDSAQRTRDRDPSDNRHHLTRSPISLSEHPLQVAAAEAGRTPVTWTQALTAIEQMLDRGEVDATVIAERFAIKMETLYRSLRRYDRGDLWERMTNRDRVQPRPRTARSQVIWADAIRLIGQLLDQGVTDVPTISDHIGVAPRGIYSSLHRLGRGDLWERMTNRSVGYAWVRNADHL
jgi:hypothetical protein